MTLVLLSCGCRVRVPKRRAHFDAGYPCLYHGINYVIHVFETSTVTAPTPKTALTLF